MKSLPRPFAACHQSFTAEKFPKDNFIVVLLEIMFKFGLHAVHIHLECLKQRHTRERGEDKLWTAREALFLELEAYLRLVLKCTPPNGK